MFLACLYAVGFKLRLSFCCAFRSASGQLPKRLEKCLPYPTLAQEIKEMQPAPKQVSMHVVRVEFDADEGIPADAQEEISAKLRSQVFQRDVDRRLRE